MRRAPARGSGVASSGVHAFLGVGTRVVSLDESLIPETSSMANASAGMDVGVSKPLREAAGQDHVWQFPPLT